MDSAPRAASMRPMLPRLLAPLTDFSYVLLRVVLGVMFAGHGAQKLFLPSAYPHQEFGTQLWFGGVIELVCGLCVATGFLTSWAAFFASGTMAVAFVQFHWKPWE